MIDNTDIVEGFFDAIYDLDFDRALEFMTDDASYHDMPVPTDPTVGKEAIRKKLDFMIAGGVTSMDYEIRHLLGRDDVVLVERSETWHFPSGANPTLRVMCAIELDDGKIKAWREYWNGEELMTQMPPEFFEGVAQAGGAPAADAT
ncbi:MAG: nuclear transport factor 2 family protein [Actinomycetota bacterium]